MTPSSRPTRKTAIRPTNRFGAFVHPFLLIALSWLTAGQSCQPPAPLGGPASEEEVLGYHPDAPEDQLTVPPSDPNNPTVDGLPDDDLPFIAPAELPCEQVLRVEAGPDLDVVPGFPVWLSGTAAASCDRDVALQFHWEQISGQPVELSNPNGAVTQFIVPEWPDPAILSFRLTATDGLASSSDTVDVRVIPASGSPSEWTFGILASTVEGPAPLTVVLTATQADGRPLPDNLVADYTWDFGDGTMASGRQVQHVYTTAATRLITLCAVLPAMSSTAVTCAEKNVVIHSSSGTGDTPPPAPAASPPVTVEQSISTPQNTPVELTFTGYSADNADLTFWVLPDTGPYHGTLGPIDNTPLNTATATYTPAPDFVGIDSFSFAAETDVLVSEPRLYYINVTPVSTPLTVSPSADSSLRVTSGGPVNISPIVYTLVNTTGSELVWTAETDVNWISLSLASGTLPAGGSVQVIAELAGNAVNLPAATLYGADVRFQAAVQSAAPVHRGIYLYVNARPVANAGEDYTVFDLDESGSETVPLSASASIDDGAIVRYRWSKGSTILYDGANATANVNLPTGVHELTLTVVDNDGALSQDTVSVTVAVPGVLNVIPAPLIPITFIGPVGGPFAPARFDVTVGAAAKSSGTPSDAPVAVAWTANASVP
ncbi:MAG: PKD domain-containing protein, partial [Phycisphaerae bacterium]